ncbi:mitogen-activated protein kinase kinase kinase, partial [Phenoliferia sp. Uapishka_3]
MSVATSSRQLFPAASSSNPGSPSSSSTFPRHDSLSLNGSGYNIALRPGTSLGQASGAAGQAHGAAGRAGGVKSWDDERVAQWLADSNCPQYADLFRKNDITGSVLFDVDQAALKEMGIKSVGDRVKIVVAIKKLRTPTQATWSPSSLSRQGSISSPSPTSSSSTLGGAANGGKRVGNGARGSGRIPPPLHLSQSNSHWHPADLPQAWQPSTANSSRSLTLPNATGTSSPRSQVSPRGSSVPPPPTLPPPRSQPLPPPPNYTHDPNSRLLATTAPTISTTAASPHPWLDNSYSLPRAPAPGNLISAPPISTYSRTPSPSSLDRKASLTGRHPPPAGVAPTRPSTSSNNPTSTSQFQLGRKGSTSRPSTSQATYGHHQPLSTHPYATSSSSSPTSDAFSTTIYGRNPPPGTAPAAPASVGANLKSLLPSPAIGKLTLSQVSEPSDASGRTSTNSPASIHTTKQQRPTTPAQSQESLDAVLRKTIKLMGDDGVSKTVAVADCRDGKEVLSRVLKKFQKPGAGGTGSGGEGEGEDQWGVWAQDGSGHYKLLTAPELFQLCSNAQATERHSLAVRRIPKPKSRGRKLQWVFGEPSTPDSNRPGGVSSPTSPNYLGVEIPSTLIEPASPSASSSDGSSAGFSDRVNIGTSGHQQQSGKGIGIGMRRMDSPTSERTKRASTVSVMSGLGAEWLSTTSHNNNNNNQYDARPNSLHSMHSLQSPSKSPLNPTQKLRNFFGQRPPSELIATHLTEYFPRAEKRLLSKSVRQSMRRSMIKRDSQYSVMSGTSWEKGAGNRDSLSPAPPSRFSGSSHGSRRSSFAPGHPTDDHSASPPQRLGTRTSGDSARTPSILEPPDESDETNTDDGDSRSIASSGPVRRRLSRMSTASRGGWDSKSDGASVITVDEVTAELEVRRASLAASYVEEDGLRPPSIAFTEDSEDEEDEEYSDSEEESEEEESFSTAPSEVAKPRLKWIKGALIGVGAFGSVYLGMNPTSGSLMAVKQVELPTGSSHNEERKKSMLDALEREIELLKVLQHESEPTSPPASVFLPLLIKVLGKRTDIVQYLDSSSDDTHLNIFLEYVPGGSVAALLSNYGAFEEALVSKFVRQILTGLHYLHEREIIHRDIKGANILVDNKGGIKISDFGISKKVEDNLLTGAHRPSLQGSVYWMAPEVVKQTSYTSKADIWSLGCLVVEMLTGQHPWANLTQMQAIFRVRTLSNFPPQ